MVIFPKIDNWLEEEEEEEEEKEDLLTCVASPQVKIKVPLSKLFTQRLTSATAIHGWLLALSRELQGVPRLVCQL